jgi:voltage-gated potassium channel
VAPLRDPREPRIRIATPILALAFIIVAGGTAIHAVGHGRWTFGDALYLALNAVSTVGFRELDGMEHVRFSHAVTALIILAGLGSVAYFQSSLTALLVQGIIGERFRVRRMQSRIDRMRDHVIVTGAGSTGMHVIEELYATRTPTVVVDQNREQLERISREVAGGEMLFIVGDATDDMVLIAAGVTRAKGVIAALTDDKSNLFVTLSARTLNAGARIVSKVIAHDAAPKMIRAGANATVSPNMMGGRRLASELVRPTVTEFIDQMLREREEVLRLDEVMIPEGSSFVGKSLREVPIRAETKLLVVALRVDKKFIYNPEPSTVLEVGSVMVVLGAAANVARLRDLVRPGAPLPSSRPPVTTEPQPPGAR